MSIINVKFAIFWNVMLRSRIEVRQRFRINRFQYSGVKYARKVSLKIYLMPLWLTVLPW